MSNVSLPVPKVGMAKALANEIAESLAAVAAGGVANGLDLRSLPLEPADLEELAEILGSGEVVATIEAAGRTEIYETQYPGVWWLKHYDTDGVLQLAEISIISVPDILRADPIDMRSAAESLSASLKALNEKET